MVGIGSREELVLKNSKFGILVHVQCHCRLSLSMYNRPKKLPLPSNVFPPPSSLSTSTHSQSLTGPTQTRPFIFNLQLNPLQVFHPISHVPRFLSHSETKPGVWDCLFKHTLLHQTTLPHLRKSSLRFMPDRLIHHSARSFMLQIWMAVN